MKLIIASMIAALLSGCATLNTEEQMAEEADTLTNRAEHKLVSPTCSNEKVEHEPSKIILEARTCGLLFDSLMAKRQLESEICRGLNLDRNECINTVKTSYLARAEDRYSLFTTAETDKLCSAYPLKCKSLRDRELAMMEAHNERVFADYFRKLREARDRHFGKFKSKSLERRERTTSALSWALRDDFKPDPK